MESLRCNMLTCRTGLSDKAVVTTCSHIFCIECANSQFNESRLCPACETSLTEPDDVVVCSLHPTNDYKTSVLSGLNPAVVLEICSRAMSFWQYQMHQELSFQQTVLRTINDKSAYLQKELDNAVREARGQIALLNNKLSEIERDLDLERRKTVSLQDSLRDREKEYQRLKVQYDKIKRKVLLAPTGALGPDASLPGNMPLFAGQPVEKLSLEPRSMKSYKAPVDVGAVVGDMNANGIQRTPIASRQPSNRLERMSIQVQPHHSHQQTSHSFFDNSMRADRTHFSRTTVSEHSEDDVEDARPNMNRRPTRTNVRNQTKTQARTYTNQHGESFAPRYAKFKPA